MLGTAFDGEAKVQLLLWHWETYHSSLNISEVAIESGNIVPPMTALLVGVSVAAGVQVSPIVRSCML